MCVEKGEICTVLGQSGSGKSTLLNVIGGLDGADGGKIAVDGADIAGKIPLSLSSTAVNTRDLSFCRNGNGNGENTSFQR